jgi:hypothetical protein
VNSCAGYHLLIAIVLASGTGAKHALGAWAKPNRI